MTPKEKAQYLVDVYSRFPFNTISITNHLEYSKKCALITVDEILKSIIDVELYLNSEDSTPEQLYYHKVKQEIEAL